MHMFTTAPLRPGPLQWHLKKLFPSLHNQQNSSLWAGAPLCLVERDAVSELSHRHGGSLGWTTDLSLVASEHLLQQSNIFKKMWNFLVVHWLRLHASNAETQIGSLVGELKSHMPCCATKKKKSWWGARFCSQKGSFRNPFSNLETSLVQGYSRRNRFFPVTANCRFSPYLTTHSWLRALGRLHLNPWVRGKKYFKENYRNTLRGRHIQPLQ